MMQKWAAKMRIVSIPFLLPLQTTWLNCCQPRPQGLFAFQYGASCRHIGKREDPGDEVKIFSEDAIILVSTKNNGRYFMYGDIPTITKMAAGAFHRVCCSAGYCQVSRHVSSLFRLQMTKTLVKHNKGFQIFYRGFFVSKGL